MNHVGLARMRDHLRTELGDLIGEALTDSQVTEIEAGSDGRVWLYKHVTGWEDTGETLSEERRRRAIKAIASLLQTDITEQQPILEGKFPFTGDRVAGSWPPSSAPAFWIRRHNPVIYSLDDYIAQGVMTPWQAAKIVEHVERRHNIVISGATDSGKTTLLNTVLNLLRGSKKHIVLIEDTQEIQWSDMHVSPFLTSTTVDMLGQVKASMRRHPDWLVIGETRDKAGFELLKAWETGHPGFTTVHANNAMGALKRFARFCEEGCGFPQWGMIRDVIDLVIHIEKTLHGRRVTEMKEVQRDDLSTDIPVVLRSLGPQHAVE